MSSHDKIPSAFFLDMVKEWALVGDFIEITPELELKLKHHVQLAYRATPMNRSWVQDACRLTQSEFSTIMWPKVRVLLLALYVMIYMLKDLKMGSRCAVASCKNVDELVWILTIFLAMLTSSVSVVASLG